MNADDAGAIRRSSRGARSIALPPSSGRRFDSVPLTVVLFLARSPSPTPRRRPRARATRTIAAPVASSPGPRVRRASSSAFAASGPSDSIDRVRSFVRSRAPTSAECRERMNRSSRVTVRLPFSSSRFELLNMWWWYECTHHRSYYLLSTLTVYTYDSSVSSDASEND